MGAALAALQDAQDIVRFSLSGRFARYDPVL